MFLYRPDTGDGPALSGRDRSSVRRARTRRSVWGDLCPIRSSRPARCSSMSDARRALRSEALTGADQDYLAARRSR